MASIKDVAKLAGVSISTVSRVINESEAVDEEKRLRVVDAIKKLDYKPNLLAKGLRLKSGNVIGLVVPEITIHAFTYIINYTLEIASEHGFNVILGCTHDDPNDEEKFIDELIRRNVNGIIFSRVSDESRTLRIVHKMNVPIVVIDRALANEGIPHVIVDNYKAGVIAAKHFIELGHKDIACVTGPMKIVLCRERLNGFSATLKEMGRELPEEYTYEGNFKFESGVEAGKYFLKNKLKITAIWGQNDLMALGVKKVLSANNYKIPEDISLMGMDNLGVVEMVQPSITTISQPFKEMCKKAFELIMLQNEKKEIIENITLLEPSLIVRESTQHLSNL